MPSCVFVCQARHVLEDEGACGCAPLPHVIRSHSFVPWQVPWWRYALLAVADVEANYFVVKAYQYTSITSVMLIDCFTIPCVMVISCLYLGTKVTTCCRRVLLCLASRPTPVSRFAVLGATFRWRFPVPGGSGSPGSVRRAQCFQRQRRRCATRRVRRPAVHAWLLLLRRVQRWAGGHCQAA